MFFRWYTAGESHGRALVAWLEGVPAGLRVDEEYVARDLARRQKGYGRGGRMKIEKDHAQILSGVRHGLTLGGPIAMLIENKDWVNWTEKMSVAPIEKATEPITRLRPGHADYPGVMKYGMDDVRNILERASARETAARVAVGAVARRFLEEFGVSVNAHVASIGAVRATPQPPIDWAKVEESPVRCADPHVEQAMIRAVDDAKAAGDTVGGVVEVIAEGAPVGLGSHVQWDRKLDARIAHAMMGINAVKGVEIGVGFAGAELPGSKVHDIFDPLKPGDRTFRRLTNNAGGIEGGMSNGEPIVVRFAVKPISTLANPLPSVDLRTGEKVQAHFERSDVCQTPPACVIGEAMLAIVLADAMLEKFGGDHMSETLRNFRGYMSTVGPRDGKPNGQRPPDDA